MYVDIRENIYMDILDSQWSPVFTLCDLLLALMSILSSPNLSDPIIPAIAALYRDNREEYEKNVRWYTQTYATGEWPSKEALITDRYYDSDE